jgi:hypothetical protein
MKNITLAIDEKNFAWGRKYAKNHNISFNALVRKALLQTIQPETNDWIDETFRIADEVKVLSNGGKWTREEIHERR